MAVIELQKIKKEYVTERGKKILALDGIDLSIEPQEFVCLLGPSGCGKSTLLRMIAGLDFPTEGTLSVLKQQVKKPIPEAQMVFQEYSLMPWRDVLENVEMALELRGESSEKRRVKAMEMLEMFGLGEFVKSFPYELSGGMQQRVAIARAMAADPQILYMDEPFGALDAHTRYQMQQELLNFWLSARKTVVFVTHSIEEALFLGTRIIVMSGHPGKILRDMKITLPYPRDRWSPEFGKLFQMIMADMGDGGNRGGAIPTEEKDTQAPGRYSHASCC